MLTIFFRRLVALRVFRTGLFAGLFLLSHVAAALVITEGEQDFSDGTQVGGVAAYNSPQSNENTTLHNFNGSDFGANFSDSWSFNYAAGTYSSASISLGLFDYDCFAACDVIASFSVDGTSFAADLVADIISTGQSVNGAYDVFNIDLTSILTDLNDGLVNMSLAFKPATNGSFTGNGGGLDFAELTLQQAVSVPEPSSCALMIAALMGMGLSRRKRT
jgi:hypothetical protein